MSIPPQNSLNIIDSHCHLDFAEFDHDRETVLNNCLAQGVNTIVIPGVMEQSWQNLIDLCSTNQALHCAIGMHPVFLEKHQEKHLSALDKTLSDNSVIAVGEIGLDFYLKELNQEQQIFFFTEQLRLANKHQLPVILHVRKAHDQTIQLLKQHAIVGGIVHAFNGSIQQAHHYIDLDFKLGFGGMLTYARSNKLRALANALPLNSIVLETDSPDMTVAAHRGERNSPEYLPQVLQALSEVRQQPIEEIALATYQNTLDVLAIPA